VTYFSLSVNTGIACHLWLCQSQYQVSFVFYMNPILPTVVFGFYVSVVASLMKCDLAMGRAKWLQK